MNELDAFWNDLTGDSPMLTDIPEFILKPYSLSDVIRWRDCEEKQRALTSLKSIGDNS